MKRSRGFTLVELLTVITVIVLLAAILLPTLGAVNKETAHRAGCANRLRAFVVANTIYASQNDGHYVPVRYMDSGSSKAWPSNQAFRDIMNLDAYLKQEDKTWDGSILQYDLPNAFACPSDKISIYAKNRYGAYGATKGILLSYAYNYTDWELSNWGDWTGRSSGQDAGHTVEGIPLPSEKLAFIDSVDWFCIWRSADYRVGWDIIGQSKIANYKRESPPYGDPAVTSLLSYDIHGPVIYRHSQGANVGFYDGHVRYMKKQQIFVRENRPGDYPAMGCDGQKKPGMWVADWDKYQAGWCR